MRQLLLTLCFFTYLLGHAQEALDQSIPQKDSLLIYDYKVKVSQLINPDPASALQYIRKIDELSHEKDYFVGKTEAYYLYASYYRRIQKLDSAIVYFNRLLELSNENNYIKGMGLSYNGLCRLNYLLGNLDTAINSCKECLELGPQIPDGNATIIPDTHIALASAYIRKNELQPAISNLLTVDSIHNVAPLRPDIIAAAFQSLGNIYTDLDDFNTAESYYLKANEEFKKLPANAASFYMQTTNRHLGEVYFYKKDYPRADSLLSSSREFFMAIKDERTVSEINTILGLLYTETNELDKATTFLNEALELNKNNIFDYEASESGIQLARVFILKKEPGRAIETLETVLQYNQGNKNSAINQQVYELKAQAYALQNNYQGAYTELQQATRLKDSLAQVQSAERIKEIEGQYQTESRDREIDLLTSQNKLAEQQKTNQRNLLLGGLAITTLLGVFFFIQYRNRQKTNEKLKELDAAKSTFFANISHEFRTPLTLIKGPLDDQLATSKLSTSQRRNLQAAQSNAHRLESLVDQLLALSKLESGNRKLQVQPGNLPRFMAVQAEAFAFSAHEKQIDFRVHVKEDNATDWFDRDALEKILFNLIGNAIKYTPEKGSIELFGTRQKEVFDIAITNTSEDLSQEERERIFDRFYQTDPQNTGSGIGLALTKELIELHKGIVFMPGNSPGFTTFAISFNPGKHNYEPGEILSEELQTNEATPIMVPGPPVELGDAAADDAPVVLVVDDNADIRQYIGTIFETTYAVRSANDGRQGFEQAIALVPDIVISDVMMPEEDGFQLTKRLKEHEITSHVPVILLTAKTEDTDKLEGLGTGADAYITKPFNSQLLLGTANNLIENRRLLQQRFAQEVILKPKEISVSSADEKFLERLQVVFDERLTDPEFTAQEFGKEMGVSRMQLHRKLKALTGQSTTEFIRTQRLKLASSLLRENKISISEVGYTVGFNDPSYFAKSFKKVYGVSPTEYVAG
ncbi:MAG: response regulator [Bacteroidota bacterium]